MAATSDQLLAVLERIDKGIAELCAMARANKQARESNGRTGPSVASDGELDSERGNPIVKAKSPRDWGGDDMTGRRFSECPPAYLDLVASRLDYFAEQNAASSEMADKQKAGWNRKDAALARGWAQRIRAGYVSPAAAASAVPGESDEIAF